MAIRPTRPTRPTTATRPTRPVSATRATRATRPTRGTRGTRTVLPVTAAGAITLSLTEDANPRYLLQEGGITLLQSDPYASRAAAAQGMWVFRHNVEVADAYYLEEHPDGDYLVLKSANNKVIARSPAPIPAASASTQVQKLTAIGRKLAEAS